MLVSQQSAARASACAATAAAQYAPPHQRHARAYSHHIALWKEHQTKIKNVKEISKTIGAFETWNSA